MLHSRANVGQNEMLSEIRVLIWKNLIHVKALACLNFSSSAKPGNTEVQNKWVDFIEQMLHGSYVLWWIHNWHWFGVLLKKPFTTINVRAGSGRHCGEKRAACSWMIETHRRLLHLCSNIQSVCDVWWTSTECWLWSAQDSTTQVTGDLKAYDCRHLQSSAGWHQMQRL